MIVKLFAMIPGQYTPCRLVMVYILVVFGQQCVCQNLIVHVQTLAKQCDIDVGNVKSNDTQYEICREWTNGREIKSWKMSDWKKITSSDDKILKKYYMHLRIETTNREGHLVPTYPAYYTEISYETSVKVPYILQKITGMDPSMHVTKHIFLHRNYLYSNIQINKIPILSFITIKNKMNVFTHKKSGVISRHYISHGDIPFFLRWSKGILKSEIIKSLDRYDEILLAKYCEKQSTMPTIQ